MSQSHNQVGILLLMTSLLSAMSLGCSKEKGPSANDPSGVSSASVSRKVGAVTPVALAAKEPRSAAGNPASPTGSSGEPSWPRFHGPKGDNLSTETGLLKQWPKDGPTLQWTVKGLGEGFATVALAGGRIYTAGDKDEKTLITALDMDGKVQWQVDNGAVWSGDKPGTRGTPTTDGDRLYHESALGDLTCYNAKSGQRIWSVNILKEFDGENIQWGLAESVLIDGDRVICCPGGNKASVAALDKMTGKTVWKTESTGVKTSYASPTLAECQGLRMILTMNSEAILGANADTGQVLFTYPHKTAYDVNATSPIYHDGHIYITSGYGSGSALLKLSVNGQKASVEEVWKSKYLDNHHGGVILLDGYLYGAASSNPWLCLEWKTGARKYSERGVGKGSLTYADGMLYTLSENRVMGLVEATPDRHKVISKFSIPSGGDGPSWAHPVVCGGRLYARHGDQLFAYDLRAGKN